MMDNPMPRLFLARAELRDHALATIEYALQCTRMLGLDAAVWDLKAARKRIEEAKEQSNG